MERKPVESSNLKSVGYDEFCQLLEVEFHPKRGETQGAIWQYFPVTSHIYRCMMEAGSIGNSFHYNVKINSDVSERRMWDLEMIDAIPEGVAVVPQLRFDCEEWEQIAIRIFGLTGEQVKEWVESRFYEVVHYVRNLKRDDFALELGNGQYIEERRKYQELCELAKQMRDAAQGKVMDSLLPTPETIPVGNAFRHTFSYEQEPVLSNNEAELRYARTRCEFEDAKERVKFNIFGGKKDGS